LTHEQKHILVASVEDKPGVMNRVSSMFRRRNFNIESIAVGHSEDAKLSRMTFVVRGDTDRVEQVRKQMDKLVEVVRIVDITNERPVSRELALIKVKANPSTRSEIIQIVDIFRANIVDVSASTLMVEVTGDTEKVESLLELLRGFGIKEITRTGLIALPRGGMGPLQVNGDTEEQQPKGKKRRASASSNTADW
jgi:acetolactate synthase I/III small subunit